MGFLDESLDLFLPSPLLPTAPLLQATPLSLEQPSFIPYSQDSPAPSSLAPSLSMPVLLSFGDVTSHRDLGFPLIATPHVPCFSSSLTGSVHSSPWALMGAASSGSHHMFTSDHTALLRLQPLAASCYYVGR